MAEAEYMHRIPSLIKTSLVEDNMPEAIASLISIATAYYEITDGDYHALELINKLVDKWLEHLAPLQYIPGLVNELDNIIEKPFWEIINIVGEDFIERIFVEPIVFKKEIYSIKDAIIKDALAEILASHAAILLEGLAGKNVDFEKYPVISSIFYTTSDPASKITELATMIALAIVLSTNKG